jgi:predicted permease
VETLGIRVETGGAQLHRVRFALVTVQVALSVVLLGGAGLMLRTLVNLQRVDLGFAAEDVVTARLALPFFAYRDPERRLQFFDRLVSGVAAEPGVLAAGAVTRLPFADADGQDWSGPFGLSAGDVADWEHERVEYRAVVPGYLDAMRARLRQGRTLEPADNRDDAPLVVLVDDVFAARVWPDDDAVGQPILIGALNPSGTGSEPRWAEVVGVVDHLRQDQLMGERRGTIFVPYHAFRWFEVSIAVRSSLSVDNVAGAIRVHAAAIDPDVPMASVRPMSDYVRDTLAPTRFILAMLVVFAAMAIVLAAVGLYGVIAYLARTRTMELGIRLAFGASPRSVARSVMLQGIRPALVGTILGVPAAVAASRLIAHLLYGVAPSDVPTYLVIVTVILGVATVASIEPAWRTTQIDPVVTLRGD